MDSLNEQLEALRTIYDGVHEIPSFHTNTGPRKAVLKLNVRVPNDLEVPYKAAMAMQNPISPTVMIRLMVDQAFPKVPLTLQSLDTALDIDCDGLRASIKQLLKGGKELFDIVIEIEDLLNQEFLRSHESTQQWKTELERIQGEPDEEEESSSDDENLAALTTPSVLKGVSQGPCTIARRFCYSHHIRCKVKRGLIDSWAKELDLSGFWKIGYPGFIIMEGPAYAAAEYCRRLLSLNWLRFVATVFEEETTDCLPEEHGDPCPKLNRMRKIPHGMRVELSRDEAKTFMRWCHEFNLDDLLKAGLRLG